MGVSGLIKLLQRRAPDAFRPMRVEELAGARVGVDVAGLIYRGLAVEQSQGPLAYLELLARHYRGLCSLGADPIYVFDGRPPIEKAAELARREAERRKTEVALTAARAALAERTDDASARETVEKLERQGLRATAEHRERAERLLRAMGAKVAVAPAEAERSLALMQRRGLVDVLFTEDVDTLLCGATSYVKNSARIQEGQATVVSLAPTLEGLGLDYEDFVSLGLLLGCDFAPKLRGMGPATALKLLKAQGTLAACVEKWPGFTTEVLAQYRAASRLLSYSSEEAVPEGESFSDDDALDALLAEVDDQGPLRRLARKRAAEKDDESCKRRC